MPIEIRRAQRYALHALPHVSTDADQLTTIAIAAKRYWGYPDRWIDVWRDQSTITAEYIVTHEVVVAYSEQEIVGFYALIDNGSIWTLDQLWVQPDSIGLGVGRQLFQHAIDRAKQRGEHSIEIEVDPNAGVFLSAHGRTTHKCESI